MNQLPNEYKQVAYIVGTGTQYIDTGVVGTTGTKVEIKLRPLATPSVRTCYFGAHYSLIINANAGVWQNASTNTKTTIIANKVYTITAEITDSKDRVMTIEDDVTSGGAADATSLSLWIGRGNDVSLANVAAAEWEYVKIWQRDTLVRDFVPCYRIDDKAVGLYDLITGTFYENKGTGTFEIVEYDEESLISFKRLQQYHTKAKDYFYNKENPQPLEFVTDGQIDELFQGGGL